MLKEARCQLLQTSPQITDGDMLDDVSQENDPCCDRMKCGMKARLDIPQTSCTDKDEVQVLSVGTALFVYIALLGGRLVLESTLFNSSSVTLLYLSNSIMDSALGKVQLYTLRTEDVV